MMLLYYLIVEHTTEKGYVVMSYSDSFLNKKADRVKQQKLKAYGDVVEALERGIAQGLLLDLEFQIDIVVGRFQYTFEVCWKTLKYFLESVGFPTKSPKEAFQQAFAQGWLGEDPEIWWRMQNDRNITAHTYNSRLAEEVNRRVQDEYYSAFKTIISELKKL